MKKLKVMTVVGTRPEIIRLSRVLSALDRYFELILVHTGQNYDYELNEVFFQDLQIEKPKYFLNAAGSNAMETIGNTLISIDRLLDKEQPQAFLVLGDTNSCLASLAAKRKKIPVFHMEAGNRCFDQRVPEEINRKIIDHIADINLPYSNIARDYLLREGISADRIIKTGSPMFEVLSYYRNKIHSSSILDQLQFSSLDYFVVSCHREENIESERNFDKFVTLLNLLVEKYEKKVFVSTHPRTRNQIQKRGISFHEKIILGKPLGFFDYIHLQQNAFIVLSDSGTITEESSILNFPAINIREAHERPEGMEEAAVIMTGMSAVRVMQAIELLRQQPRGSKKLLQSVDDYCVPNVSEKVARLILSYTDYTQNVVWKNFNIND